MKLEQIHESIPPALGHVLNWTAFGAAMGWVFGTVVPAIVGVLSGVWLGLQIWLFLFVKKPWRHK